MIAQIMCVVEECVMLLYSIRRTISPAGPENRRPTRSAPPPPPLLFRVFIRKAVNRETLQCKREDLLLIRSSLGVCDRRDVMARWSTRVALLTLLIGHILAGPETSSSNACQDHKALHERMDGVEERLESGVQKLQEELDLLMEELEAREWRPLVDGSHIDLLDEPPNP